jgi:hypothetical protein
MRGAPVQIKVAALVGSRSTTNKGMHFENKRNNSSILDTWHVGGLFIITTMDTRL